MPGFDGSGPAGMGPMTGGARGYCNPGVRRGSGYRFFRRPSYAYPYYSAPAAYDPRTSREQEVAYLKSQAGELKSMLEGINERIEQLVGDSK